MKKKTSQQLLEDYRKGIKDSVNRWKFIKENGCGDPFYPDGYNMNLVRNHVLYYKAKIYEICEQENFEIPEECYTPTPPEIDNNFMSNLDQEERIKRLIQLGNKLVTKQIDFEEQQLSIF